MKLDLNTMALGEKIKLITAYRGLTLKKLGEVFNQRCGTKYSPTSFQRKIRTGAISYEELKVLGNILSFDIDIRLTED